VLTRNQVLHYHEGQAGRGLGLTRQAIPRFYQTTLEVGDLLVVCADPPATWNPKTLANSPQLSFDHLRRRLLSEAGTDLQVGVIRLQAGKGQVSYWRPGEAQRAAGRPASEGRPASRPVPSSPKLAAGVIEAAPSQETATSIANLEPGAGEDGKKQDRPGVFLGEMVAANSTEQSLPLPPTPRPVRQEPAVADANPALPGSAAETARPESGGMLGTGQQQQKSKVKQPGSDRGANRSLPNILIKGRVASDRTAQKGPGIFKKGVAAFGLMVGSLLQRTRPFRGKVSGSISGAAARVIPRKMDSLGRPEPFFNLSPAQMLAVALIIPLVVVTVATTVYFQSGRSEQFQLRYLKAEQYAQQASQLEDPVQQRESWRQAYAMLLEADKFGESDEAQALRQQAISALDGLEGYVRLNYQPVVRGGFSPDVNITRIVATLNDVYMLDASQGRILRLFRTASGYEIDPTFSCGAGQSGTTIINPLIDLVALPPNNNMHSTVMGMDAGGNLVYCSPSQSGFDSRPLVLPDSGWGELLGMTLSNDTLYVLDPQANAVYWYDGKNGVFDGPPHLFFDATIPQMNDVMDLAVDQEFLYLLHDDGRMTVCEASGFEFAATKCTDPAPYGDTRPGYEPAPLTFTGSAFTQIQTTQPPDPSLYALDAANQSIYHLSLRRLNLQRQYRSLLGADFPLPNESASAFAISPNRRALLAFGNQVYFATIP